MKIAINKNRFVFLLLFSFSILLFIFSLGSKVIACPSGCGSHTYCGCTGTGGCVYRSYCLSDEVRVTCGAASSMCCDKGICVDCQPCSGDYQSSNNGCSSATRSCTKNYCIGGSCGTRSATCYRVKYTVSANGNGGTCSPASQSICGDTASGTLTCSRSGYTFSGFTITSGSCGGTFNSSTGVCSKVIANMTIQANWTIVSSYTVNVDANGGTCSPGTHNVNSGSSSLSQTCSRTGYTLSSFTITSGSCSSFNTSTGVCSSVTQPITIRANWSINSYYVSVNGNGGTCLPGSHYVNYGSASSAQTCIRTGYTFSSFSITSGSCSSFNTSTGVCSSVTQPITIQANWSINSYYVSVNGNGGTCSPGSHYVDYGNPSSSQTCSRTGYTFSGFTITSGSCGGSFTSSTGVCSKVTGSIAIRANWQCIPISCNCSPLSSSSTSYGSKTVTCSDGCGGTTSRECWCTNNCTPQSCPSGTSESGTHGIYATYTCTNECNKSNSRTCKCISACTLASCPAGTTERNTGDYYSLYSCTNMCNESLTKNCYCSICTPPTCSNSGYSDTNLGYGQVPLEKTPSCRNGYNAPDYISKCDMTYRTCYCYSCLKQCPSPLANTGSSNLILNDFRECTNDCDVKPPEDQDDCYEVPSEQPTESLAIDGEQADPNEFGFLSLTHTGDNKNIPRQGDLNDPLSPIKMVATYTDTDGADDIEGMFVWFRESQNTGELDTPLYISETETPQALTNDSWGFMLRKNETSDWDPYVPSYQEAQPSWTKAIYTTTLLGYRVFYISGPNAKQMVEVTILKQPLKEGDKVTMEFSLRFSNSEGILYNDPVAEGKYNIYLMGLDKFSFTPYDNYDINYRNFWSEGFKYYGEENLSPFWKPNQLRYKPEQGQTYARSWTDAGKTWTIDRKGPYIDAFAFGVPEENKLEVHWNVNDDRSLYAVVGNIYTTEGPLSREITLSTDNSNILLHEPNSFFPGEAVEENIGKLSGDWAFKVKEDIGSASNSGQIYIDVGENTSGLFRIYLTVFDDAGNMSNSVITINIADWFATAGGVAYSAGGSNFSTKDIYIEEPHILSLPYPSSNPGLSLDKADSSSELWAEGVSDDPDELVKSLISKSYNITRYLGYKLTTEGYYDYLKKEYEMNKKNIDNLEEVSPESPDLFGSLNGICNSQPYCMFEYTGDLNVWGDVICDNRSLIFVEGDLTIETPLKNTRDNQLSNKNGCIFVVKGDVTVQKGGNMSSTNLGYDIVNGYILADGQIIIEDESDKRLLPNTDPIIDGVYINGGLSSSYKGGTGIMINRYLRVEEKFTYPVLVIDYHPKYGVIAEKFFGRKSTVKAVEIGVKP